MPFPRDARIPPPAVFLPRGKELSAKCFAYVYVVPASFAPAMIVGRALEDIAGNPLHTQPSSCGALIVEFPNALVRERAVTLSPLHVGSYTVILECHEEVDNRFHLEADLYADVVTIDFPLEHWFEGHVMAAFRVIGHLTCMVMTTPRSASLSRWIGNARFPQPCSSETSTLALTPQ